MQVLSLFCPYSSKYQDTWEKFDKELSFKEQLVTITVAALAAFASLPILGLGGMAAFRLMVDHYCFTHNPSKKPCDGAEKADRVAREKIPTELTLEQWMESAWSNFSTDMKGNDVLQEHLESVHAKFEKPNVILTELAANPILERFELLELALEVGDCFTDTAEFSKLIKELKKIAVDEREAELTKALPFLKGLKTAGEVTSILKNLRSFSEEKLVDLSEQLKPLLDQFSRASDRITLIKIFDANVGSDNGSKIDELIPLLIGVTNLSLYPSIIEAVEKIENEDIKELLTLAKPLLENVGDNGHATSLILQVINDIPKEQRAELIEGITHYLKGMKGTEILRLLQFIKSLDYDERIQIVLCSIPHIDDAMSQENRQLTLEALTAVGREQRETVDTSDVKSRVEVMQSIKSLFGKFNTAEERIELTNQLKRVPHTERNALLSLIAPSIDKIETAKQLGDLLYGFFLIAPDYREKVFTSLQSKYQSADSLSRFTWRDIVGYALRQMPDNQALKNATYQYLERMLVSITETKPALELSTLIWDNRLCFGLLEEMPLAQLAMRTMIICDPTISGELKNKFNVYKKHVLTSKIETPNITIPYQEVEGIRVRLNQKVLEQRAKSEVKVTFADLPENVNSETAINLFNKLKERVHLLGEEGKQQISGYVRGSIGAEISSLSANFTADPYLVSLLSASGQSTDAAPKDVQRFYSILNYIQSLSNSIDDGELLSPREDALVKISASIQGCSSGKSEGIALAYNLLPKEFKLGSVASAVDLRSREKTIAVLDSIIQAFLLPKLSEDNALMKALVGSQNVNQISHQSQYIKNQIAQRLGLKHELAFDHYTGCVLDTLFNRSLKELLDIAFQHIKPQQFVDQLLEQRKIKMRPRVLAVIQEERAKLKELENDEVYQEYLESALQAIENKDKVDDVIATFKEKMNNFYESEIPPKPNYTNLNPVELAKARINRQKDLKPFRDKLNLRIAGFADAVGDLIVENLVEEYTEVENYVFKKVIVSAIKNDEPINEAIEEAKIKVEEADESKLMLAELMVEAQGEEEAKIKVEDADEFNGYFREFLSSSTEKKSELWDIDVDLGLQMITRKGVVAAFISAGYFEVV